MVYQQFQHASQGTTQSKSPIIGLVGAGAAQGSGSLRDISDVNIVVTTESENSDFPAKNNRRSLD
jgi:hypothetical protein